MIHKQKELDIIWASGDAGPLVTGGARDRLVTAAALPEGGEVFAVIFSQL